jgi:hypothetical protein
MVARSELPKKVTSGKRNTSSKYPCDSKACWCRGGKSCLALTERTDCKSFRCNNDGGQPVCWCDL